MTFYDDYYKRESLYVVLFYLQEGYSFLKMLNATTAGFNMLLQNILVLAQETYLCIPEIILEKLMAEVQT